VPSNVKPQASGQDRLTPKAYQGRNAVDLSDDRGKKFNYPTPMLTRLTSNRAIPGYNCGASFVCTFSRFPVEAEMPDATSLLLYAAALSESNPKKLNGRIDVPASPYDSDSKKWSRRQILAMHANANS
jgi:hypothetical protein